jgi:hypothetical protein
LGLKVKKTLATGVLEVYPFQIPDPKYLRGCKWIVYKWILINGLCISRVSMDYELGSDDLLTQTPRIGGAPSAMFVGL